jgi:hypothetical protein
MRGTLGRRWCGLNSVWKRRWGRFTSGFRPLGGPGDALPAAQGARMPFSSDPLVLFNSGYYRYPMSVSRGAWSRFPADVGLDATQRNERLRWISEIERRSTTVLSSELHRRFSDRSDGERLLRMVPRFGVFIERFFFRAIRPRLLETFA